MNESKILRIACDPTWYAHAYSEYLADVAENVSNLMASLQEILSFENFDVASAVDVFEKHGVNPEARFIIGEYGGVQALQLAINMWNESESVTDYEPDYEYSIEEALSVIRGSWTQAVISSKAFESFTPAITNQVDRVSRFLQDIQSNFTIDDSVRDTINYYQSLINSSNNVEMFVKNFLQSAGVDEADDTNDPLAYINSDLYKYTGNTPGIALDFSTVNAAITSTVSVAAKTIKGVFNLAKQGITWLFNKTKKYVVDTVIDPAVCEYIDNGELNEGYLDGFAWFGEFVPNVQYSGFLTGGQISSVFNGFHDLYAEKWIKIKLKVGEFLFRIVSNDNKWQCYFKPVAVDVDYFRQNYIGPEVVPVYRSGYHAESIQEYASWLEVVMDSVQPVSKDANKNQLYQGFSFGTMLAQSIIAYAFQETYELVQGTVLVPADTQLSSLRYLSEIYDFEPLSEEYEVTNAKLILSAAGDPTNVDNVHSHITFSDSLGVSLSESSSRWSMQASMTNLIAIWAMCRNERRLNPDSYTFVPYSNNHTALSPASWRVRSDQEIADKRDNFLEILIVAAIVITALVFVGVTARKISRDIFFKRKQVLNQLDKKMWSGGRLTDAEKRKYIRYNRRINLSRWLDVGSNDNYTSISNDNQLLISLIQG